MTFFWAVLALLLHLVSGVEDPCRAQRSRKDDIVFNSRGVPLAGASVRVCTMPATGQPCTPIARIYSDTALTQALTNPTPTNALGNDFFYASPRNHMIEVNAFSLNSSGNLAVNGSTTELGKPASSTLILTNQSKPPSAANSDSVNLAFVAGVAANPVANNGDLQSKNSTPLQEGGINDQGTTPSTSRDQQNAGPNPSFDIRAFGAVNSTSVMTGCAIRAGSAILTCSTNPNFKDATQIPGSSLGHGVIVYGAGALPTITTPGRPTIVPNLLNGATTWNYKVVAEDYAGGVTAASGTGTTTKGSSALGVTTVRVSSSSLSAGVITYTTSSAHNLQPGMQVILCKFGGFTTCFNGSAYNPYNGTKTILATPTSTTFTTNEGDVPIAVGTSSGDGEVHVLACNKLTFGATSFSGTGTLRYWIYRSQGAGAFSLAGVAVGLDPYFVDCGATAPANPGYVPSAPPVSAQAGYFATSIVRGGGTNTLTLASTASTSVSGQTVRHDNTPSLMAAAAATANQGGGTVYIPSVPLRGGVFSDWPFLSLANFTKVLPSNSNYFTVLINGSVGLGAPWVLRGNMKIEGQTKVNTAFMYPGGALIDGFTQPLLYFNTRSSIELRNLLIQPLGQQGVGIYGDSDALGNGSNGIVLEKVGVRVVSGLGFGRPMVFKGGFDYFFRQVTCSAEAGSAILPEPCIEFTNHSTAVFNGTTQIPGRVAFDGCYFNNSGISVNAAPNPNFGSGYGYRFTEVLAEGLVPPFLRVGPIGRTGGFLLTDIINADQASGGGTPLVDASGSNLLNLSVTGGVTSGAQPVVITTGSTTLTANYAASINVGNARSFVVTNTDARITGEPFKAIAGGRFAYAMDLPGAMTSCVVSAGGRVPVGTQSYALTAVDADGNETTVGAPVNVTTSSGSQTVTCNLPAKPAGAMGFNIYQNGVRVSPGTCMSPQLTGTTMVLSGSLCDNGHPTVNAAGSSILSSSGLSTYQLRLNGQLLTGTSGSSGMAATSRGSFVQGHLPTFDSNNNLTDTGVSPTSVSDYFNRADSNLGSEPNSPWTIESGTLLVTGGGVGGNTAGQNYAVFTGVGFPNDDQNVSAVWVKTGTPTLQNNVLTLRGSPTALTNYNCGPSNMGTALTIGKFIAGSFTSLVSQSSTINSGDIISFNTSGASLTCYVNGVLIAAATDASITSGFPGVGAFQIYNTNSANLKWKNWMASPGYVSLQRPQTWSRLQTFSPGIAIGTETISASPRGPLSVFFPGSLTSRWTGESWTLDKAVTITRVQVQAKTAPAGCTTNAVIRVSDGTTPVNLTVAAAANDSGAISQNYPAGATLTISVQTAAAGCATSPSDANTVIQYKMQ
jgi:hypothetical protein